MPLLCVPTSVLRLNTKSYTPELNVNGEKPFRNTTRRARTTATNVSTLRTIIDRRKNFTILYGKYYLRANIFWYTYVLRDIELYSLQTINIHFKRFRFTQMMRTYNMVYYTSMK